MRKKAKGVTLIELIIVMGITLVVMSSAYSFLNTSNKSTAKEDLKSTLQSEGNIIENKILTIATQAKGAKNIVSEGIKIDNTKIVNVDLDSEGNFNLTSIELLDYDGNSSVIKLENNILTINTNEENTQVLSENVLEMKAQPLNTNQLTDSEKKAKTMGEISGYKFSFKLGAKKGIIETDYNITVQANFRNYDVELSKAKQEFNKFEEAITNTWSKSESLINVSDLYLNNVLNMDLNLYDSDNGIEITSMSLKQYDGSTVSIKIDKSKNILTIGKENSISKEFSNIVGFKIKVLDSDITDKTLKDVSGFKILVTLKENNIESTYEAIVKFKNN